MQHSVEIVRRPGTSKISLTCPVLGCTRKRKRHEVMCKSCWFKVPTAIRSQVWNLFTDVTKRGGSEHVAAIEEAISSVPIEKHQFEA